MMRGVFGVRAIGASVVFACAGGALGQATLTTARVASGLVQPLQVTHAPGDFARLYVVERGGRVKIVEGGVVRPQAFLDISALVTTSWLEWGLLGMCFDPDYATNGFIYVNYSSGTGGDTNIARFTRSAADPDRIDPASRETVLFLQQPNQNHRGGWLGFGPEGYLYFSLGDGGGQNDPNNRGQNLNVLQGKINRIDVHGPDAYPADANKNYAVPTSNPFFGQIGAAREIWAYGLRNPWRCSFDRATHDLWIGDVGQSAWEEIDFQAAGFAGGANYGWRCMEGNHCTGMTGCTCNAASLVRPVHEYARSIGQSVTGGYVYRGCAMPEWDGTYFFADYQTGRIFSFRYAGGVVTELLERTAQLDPPGSQSITSVASFGEDAYGELYMCDYNGGEIFKIVPGAGVGPDCNDNGVRDACEILDGSVPDANGNGVPDGCDPPPHCPVDWNSDGSVTSQDFFDFLAAFFAKDADFNADGATNSQDFFDFLTAFFGEC
jgi:glucose/arabinose dehydrogenase